MAVRHVRRVDFQNVVNHYTTEDKRRQILHFLTRCKITFSTSLWSNYFNTQLSLNGLFVQMNYCLNLKIPYENFTLKDPIDECINEILNSYLDVNKRGVKEYYYY